MESLYLGIDISKNKFDVALMLTGRAKCKVFANCAKGFASLKIWLEEIGSKPRICMEATGIYGHALATFLHENSYPVSMVNPARVKGFAQSEMARNKTDKADAQVIARFCKAMQPDLWQPDPAWQLELKQWVSHLDNLKKMQRQEENRIESACKSVSVAIKKHIKSLGTQITKAEEHIKNIIKNNTELKKKKELLLSIPGIGETTIAKLLAYLGNIERFDSAKKVASYAGLTPSHKQSGTSVKGRTSLSKRGNPMLRKALFMPALTAIKYNPILKQFYLKLLERGKAKMCAIGAVMRKMLHLIFGVLKNNEAFNGAKLN